MKKKEKKKHPVLRVIGILLLVLLSLVFLAGCCVYGMIRGAISSAPSIDTIDISPTGYVTTIYDANGSELQQLVASGSNRIYTTLDEIPEDTQHAFVAIEDSRFYEHNGVDYKGIMRAAYQGIRSGFHFDQGASTITQQLLKNNVFTDWTSESSLGQSLKRKIQEQYLAVELEKRTDKDTILENYLNTINLGENTLGVQSASRRYFGKDVSELTLSESTVLAAIPQNPTRYNPITNPEENAKRRQTVLQNMLDQGWISQEQFDEASADPVYDRIQTVNSDTKSSAYSYFTDALIDQVKTDLMEEKGYSESQANKLIYSGGLSIYSTQDPAIQTICDEEYANEANYPDGTQYSIILDLAIQHADGTISYYDEQSMLTWVQSTISSASYLLYSSQEEALDAVHSYEEALMTNGDTIPENGEQVTYTPQPQSSMVIIDQRTGCVVAMVGGRGEKKASLTLNRAYNTTRQPGSTFKIVSTYAPALESGKYTLASALDDAPYDYTNGKELNNVDNRYRGFTTIREAIRDSVNIVAVKVLTDITPETGYEYLEDFGFTTLTEDDKVQALSLGGISKGVTNLEMTASYAAIANGGTYTKPRLYTKILDHDGNVLIDNEPQTREVISPQTSYLLTSAMEDVVTEGTGTEVNFGTTPIAGKTGTTDSKEDSWFVGYTDYYTCGVWGGYDTNAPLETTTFTRLLWRSVMSRIHESLPYRDFTEPDGLVKETVCKKSGLLPVEDVCKNDPRGDMTYEEIFTKGTVPKAKCNHHVVEDICGQSGLLATQYCPTDQVSSSVFITGTASGTEDAAYLAPTKDCDIHTADSLGVLQEDAEVDTDGDGVADGIAAAGTYYIDEDGNVVLLPGYELQPLEDEGEGGEGEEGSEENVLEEAPAEE